MGLIRAASVTGTVITANTAIQFIKISVFAVICRFETIAILIASVIFQNFAFRWNIVVAAAVSLLGVMLVIAPSVFGFSGGKESL